MARSKHPRYKSGPKKGQFKPTHRGHKKRKPARNPSRSRAKSAHRGAAASKTHARQMRAAKRHLAAAEKQLSAAKRSLHGRTRRKGARRR